MIIKTQKQAISILKKYSHSGLFKQNHISVGGANVVRIFDEKYNPICNIDTFVYKRLEERKQTENIKDR